MQTSRSASWGAEVCKCCRSAPLRRLVIISREHVCHRGRGICGRAPLGQALVKNTRRVAMEVWVLGNHLASR